MWAAARGFNVQVKSSTSQGSEVLCSYHAVFRSQISIPPYCLYIFFMFVKKAAHDVTGLSHTLR